MSDENAGGGVRLVEPFPPEAIADLYRWLRASTISKADGFPSEAEEFSGLLSRALPGLRSWAVYDKSDGALIGNVMFEPVGLMGGRSYIASARRAWGTGLMDEAARRVRQWIFTDDQRIGYIFGMVLANNAPARAFNERIGMTLKNILPGYSDHGGKRRDMLIFEITREQWQAQQQQA